MLLVSNRYLKELDKIQKIIHKKIYKNKLKTIKKKKNIPIWIMHFNLDSFLVSCEIKVSAVINLDCIYLY